MDVTIPITNVATGIPKIRCWDGGALSAGSLAQGRPHSCGFSNSCITRYHEWCKEYKPHNFTKGSHDKRIWKEWHISQPSTCLKENKRNNGKCNITLEPHYRVWIGAMPRSRVDKAVVAKLGIQQIWYAVTGDMYVPILFCLMWSWLT